MSGSGKLTIAAGVTLQGGENDFYNTDLNADSGAIDILGTLNVNNSGGAGFSITSGSGGSWTNDGTLEATGGGHLNLSGTWTNDHGHAINILGSTVSFNGTWSNQGTFTSQGAAVAYLNSTYTLASLGSYTRDPNGQDTFVKPRSKLLPKSFSSAVAGASGPLWKNTPRIIRTGPARSVSSSAPPWSCPMMTSPPPEADEAHLNKRRFQPDHADLEGRLHRPADARNLFNSRDRFAALHVVRAVPREDLGCQVGAAVRRTRSRWHVRPQIHPGRIWLPLLGVRLRS